MNCNFNSSCSCNACKNFAKTTAVALVGNTLVLTIPNTSLCNCSTKCIMIAQPIPSTVTANTNVAISINGVTYTAITPCCANNLYADQITSYKVYSFKFATDTLCFIYKGGWRLCPTKHIFNCIPLPAVVTNVAEAVVASKTIKSNTVSAKTE